MASKDTAAKPNSTPTKEPEAFTSSSSSLPKPTLTAALQALHYDHASTPNTGDVPPIAKWENILMGKKWIAEHSAGDDDDDDDDVSFSPGFTARKTINTNTPTF